MCKGLDDATQRNFSVILIISVSSTHTCAVESSGSCLHTQFPSNQRPTLRLDMHTRRRRRRQVARELHILDQSRHGKDDAAKPSFSVCQRDFSDICTTHENHVLEKYTQR